MRDELNKATIEGTATGGNTTHNTTTATGRTVELMSDSIPTGTVTGTDTRASTSTFDARVSSLPVSTTTAPGGVFKRTALVGGAVSAFALALGTMTPGGVQGAAATPDPQTSPKEVRVEERTDVPFVALDGVAGKSSSQLGTVVKETEEKNEYLVSLIVLTEECVNENTALLESGGISTSESYYVTKTLNECKKLLENRRELLAHNDDKIASAKSEAAGRKVAVNPTPVTVVSGLEDVPDNAIKTTIPAAAKVGADELVKIQLPVTSTVSPASRVVDVTIKSPTGKVTTTVARLNDKGEGSVKMNDLTRGKWKVEFNADIKGINTTTVTKGDRVVREINREEVKSVSEDAVFTVK